MSSESSAGTTDTEESPDATDEIRVWLVNRTYSDDEQNIVILEYATPDGEQYLRKERALTSFTGPNRETLASLTVPRSVVASVADPELSAQYAAEVDRMKAQYAPSETV